MNEDQPRLTASWKESTRFDGDVLPFGQQIDLDPRKVGLQLHALRCSIEDGDMPPLAASVGLLDHSCRMIEAMVQFMLGLDTEAADQDPEQLERVARAMCRADGLNPDRIVAGSLSEFVEQATDMPAVDVDHQAPQWHRYRRGARQFLASTAALGA